MMSSVVYCQTGEVYLMIQKEVVISFLNKHYDIFNIITTNFYEHFMLFLNPKCFWLIIADSFWVYKFLRESKCFNLSLQNVHVLSRLHRRDKYPNLTCVPVTSMRQQDWIPSSWFCSELAPAIADCGGGRVKQRMPDLYLFWSLSF